MVKKISIAIVMILAFIALLQGNVFAAEKFPEAVDGVIKLTEDVTLAEPAIINSAVTLDLNGHKINHTVAFWDFGGNEENDAVIVVQAGGDLTIKGEGTLTALKDDCYGISVRNGGKLKIYGGTYIGNVSAVYVRKGSAEIYGGTFDLDQLYNGYIYELNCKDEAYKDGSASIITYGGTYKNFSPDNAAEPSAPQSYVPEGYTVVKKYDNELKGWWYEVQSVELVKEYTSANGAVTINENITANGCNGAIYAHDGANVTITGGNIHGQVCADCNSSMALWALGKETKVTIKGGNFTNDTDGTNHCDLIYVKDGAIIRIEGGTFRGCTPSWTLNSHDTISGLIEIVGGKFYNFNPATANETEGDNGQGIAPDGKVEVEVLDGYTVVGPVDGWYEVVCAHDKSNIEGQPARPATYVEEGNEAYYICKGNNCGKWFKDAEGKEEITDKSSIVIPKLIEVNDKEDEVVVKDEAVDNAVADATANNTDVVIPLGNIGTTVSSVELPVEKLEVVAGTDKALVVETTEAVVTIDNKALEEVVKQAGAEPTITLEVKKVEEKVLSETQQAVIENKEVAFVFTAEMLANGKEISNFNGGKVKVAIPFTPAENTNASDYKVFYIADDGSISEVLTQYVDGKIVVELEHFSEYALINVNKVANQGGTGSAAPAPATKDNTPKTGAMSFVVVLMVIASVGYVVTKKEIR